MRRFVTLVPTTEMNLDGGGVIKISAEGPPVYYQVCMRIHDEWVLQEIGPPDKGLCPGDTPDLKAKTYHKVSKDTWDKLGGAPVEPKTFDTWDMAKPK